MTTLLAAATDTGQQWRQIDELLVAFVLSSAIGLERQFRGKSAGLRTQAIVGTASALFLLISKYGFTDVLVQGSVVVDPSRVAAQIVSGIGFLGAGLIITRRGAIRGLTTAASVWETAAIGMAAGAGLPVLALVVTGLHFLIVFGYTPLGRIISDRGHVDRSYTITYEDGHGVLRHVIAACSTKGWNVRSMLILEPRELSNPTWVTINLRIRGAGVENAPSVFTQIDGVVGLEAGDDDE